MAFAAVVMLGNPASAQQKFTAALNPLQEVPPTNVPPVNSLGRGSCLITLNTAQTQITTVSCEYSRLSSGITVGHIHAPAPPGTNAGVLFDLTPPVGTTSGTFTRGPFPATGSLTAAQLADLRAKRWYVNLHTTNAPGGEIRGQVKIQTTPYDNDGDGRTDIKVYRPSTFTTYGIFSVNNTIFTNVFGFGVESPLSSAADDYDGDGRGDLVLLRVSNGVIVWRILQTASNTVREVYWGLTSTFDDLVPADYDGDGKTDIAVYRYTTGIWYILQSSNNQLRAEFWGQPGNPNEYGVVGDFDGDGRSDLTVMRYTSGAMLWSTRLSSNNAFLVREWGASATDSISTVAQIDVDGDGIQDRMVVRDPNPRTQTANNFGDRVTILVMPSGGGAHLILPFGLDTDVPFAGDYDGDGRTDFVARRDEGGTLIWYIAQSSNNWNTSQPRVVRWGLSGDFLAEDSIADEFPTGVRIK